MSKASDAFGPLLRKLMDARKINASNLARLVWGETTDRRGYKVARNRDRIGHYLAGTSFPEDENLRKIADALEHPYEDLAATRAPSGPVPSGVPRTKVHRDATHAQLNAILQLKPKMRLETALRILDLIAAEDEPS